MKVKFEDVENGIVVYAENYKNIPRYYIEQATLKNIKVTDICRVLGITHQAYYFNKKKYDN